MIRADDADAQGIYFALGYGNDAPPTIESHPERAASPILPYFGARTLGRLATRCAAHGVLNGRTLSADRQARSKHMNWTLEVIVVPVSDVDRAKAFYAEQLGFSVDHDTTISEGNRIVQLTPPGSGCSIVVGEGIVPDMPSGSLKGLQLVVADINAARAQLVERDVDVSDIQVLGESPSPQPNPLDNVGFVFFSDPDGNGWAVQQISARG
jgi:catechol 2,3-dioxygenase-like lactoylglutathione lyase family enzyme